MYSVFFFIYVKIQFYVFLEPIFAVSAPKGNLGSRLVLSAQTQHSQRQHQGVLGADMSVLGADINVLGTEPASRYRHRHSRYRFKYSQNHSQYHPGSKDALSLVLYLPYINHCHVTRNDSCSCDAYPIGSEVDIICTNYYMEHQLPCSVYRCSKCTYFHQ
jgi:hypothetical protein